MATTQYIGARYVPLFAEPLDWSIDSVYEALTIVYYAGNSYTSRQAVPKGIDITNEKFWALTGNYNAQIEQYRKEVAAMGGRVTENAQKIADEVSRAVAQEAAIKSLVEAEVTRAKNAEAAINAALDTEKNRATDAENELNTALNTEVERSKAAESLITKNLDLKTLIPDHLPGAKFAMREVIDKTKYSAQGSCVFPPENPKYVAMAVQNTSDATGYIKIINYNTKAEVATLNGTIGHGSTITYYDNVLYVSGFNEGNIMYRINVATPSSPSFIGSVDTGNYIPWGVIDSSHLLVSSTWANIMTLYSYNINTGDVEQLAVTPNVEEKALMQCVGYDSVSELFYVAYSSLTSKVVFFNSDNSFIKTMTFAPFYMFAAVLEIEQVQLYGSKIWFSNNPEGFNSLPFRHVANVWEADLTDPTQYAITDYSVLSNISFTMDDDVTGYTTIDDIDHAISNDYNVKLKYAYDISGFLRSQTNLVHLIMNKDYTADILFADLDGKTLWVDFNNHIGSGIYVNNGKAHIRTVGTFINDADKMAMTEKGKKVFCNCTCAEIYISNVPSNAAMFCVYGVCYEAHLRSDVASTVSNFVGGYDYVAVGDLTLSKTS